jgi:hypothetical protein
MAGFYGPPLTHTYIHATGAPSLSHLKHFGIERIENTVPHYYSSTVAMGACLCAKPLFSSGSCIFAYLAIVAQQGST